MHTPATGPTLGLHPACTGQDTPTGRLEGGIYGVGGGSLTYPGRPILPFQDPSGCYTRVYTSGCVRGRHAAQSVPHSLGREGACCAESSSSSRAIPVSLLVDSCASCATVLSVAGFPYYSGLFPVSLLVDVLPFVSRFTVGTVITRFTVGRYLRPWPLCAALSLLFSQS